MPAKSEFVEYLVEQLQPLGEVTARSMFGGWGIYADGRMFALVADEAFYIKVDDVNCREFEARDLKPFRYDTKNGRATIRYYEPPAEALDDREILCTWARKGVEAAKRAAPKKRATKRK
jgi:DNA transformation protein